jgi:hypothetical protein
MVTTPPQILQLASPARTAWRAAVATVAEKATQTLPQCNGRVEKAVQIVLAGDVELLPDGKAKVASQSNGATQYFVVNGHCPCQDAQHRAPEGRCKHLLAAWIHKRASILATQQLAAMDAPAHQEARNATNASRQDPHLAPQGDRRPTALPEAPASANVYVELAGRKVQLTLRDTSEQQLLARLEALLKQFPAEAEAEQDPPAGWCARHQVQMQRNTTATGSWWSHKTTAGWCRGQ